MSYLLIDTIHGCEGKLYIHSNVVHKEQCSRAHNLKGKTEVAHVDNWQVEEWQYRHFVYLYRCSAYSL